LLYDDAFWKFQPHVDHIFPQKLFSKKKLAERGIAPAEQEGFLEMSNRLGNLQILTAPENHEKSGTEFDKWIKTRGKGFLERQLIPSNDQLWDVSMFPKFLEAREKLIRKRLQSLFAL
jgi:hypothetical protein